MPDFSLAALRDVIRPQGPFARSTLYRLAQDHPGLLRRLPGLRDTFVDLATLRQIEAGAEPVKHAQQNTAA